MPYPLNFLHTPWSFYDPVGDDHNECDHDESVRYVRHALDREVSRRFAAWSW